jgi:hypothetical protein
VTGGAWQHDGVTCRLHGAPTLETMRRHFPIPINWPRRPGLASVNPIRPFPEGGQQERGNSARRRGFVMPKHGAFHMPLLKKSFTNV